jgi:hypothetical protein
MRLFMAGRFCVSFLHGSAMRDAPGQLLLYPVIR